MAKILKSPRASKALAVSEEATLYERPSCSRIRRHSRESADPPE